MFNQKTKYLSYIIGKACIGIKDGACIDACPVDCIHIGEKQMYIDPEECIDCGACEPECPVDAIYDEDDLPEEYEKYTEINANFFEE